MGKSSRRDEEEKGRKEIKEKTSCLFFVSERYKRMI
jgi:hypothetical protein